MNPMVLRSFAFTLLVLVASNVLAAEWSIEPSIDARANLTDNLNLTPGVRENVFNWTVSPRVIFARRTEISEVTGTASLGFNRYPDDPSLDTTDANFSLGSQLRSERNTYGLSAAYIRDSTLQTELATTGIVQTRTQRDLVTISPSWSYSLTERSSVFAQYQYDHASYEAGAGFIDYSNQQASAGYQYLIAERVATTLSGNYSRYEADDGSIISNSNGFSVGLKYSHSEKLAFDLSFGVRRSDTTITNSALLCEFGAVAICDFFGIPLQRVTATATTADDGYVYSASADYKWERTSASMVLSRDINPTGSGLVVETDRIAIQIGHQFSEKLSGNVYAAYLSSRYITGFGSDTEYSSLSSSLSWKLDERWTTGAGYSFSYQKVKNASESASANTVYLSISYNWPKISISR
jgi:hypothetical protein